MSKQAITLKVMNANADKGIADVLPILAKELGYGADIGKARG